MEPPTFDDVVAAAPVVRRHLRPTPLYEWPALSRLLGFRYLLKHENHTPTTAFKVRGGLNVIARLPDEQKRDPATQDMYKRYAGAIASMNKLNVTPIGQ